MSSYSINPNNANNTEEAAELLATIKADHVHMKTWYNNTKDNTKLTELKNKYGGSYPDFARDVASWPGWRDVRRMYLQHTNTAAAAPVRKRRKRWGTTDANSSTGTADNAQPEPSSSPSSSRRKSRWARDGPNNNNNNNTANPQQQHQQQPPPPGTGILGLLPGIPAGMTPEQLRQLSTLQTRLRTANERLANLDTEALRIDSLPRDHPSRSPSPPPRYDSFGKRTNTRAVRWRERYGNERQDVLEKMMDLNPSMRPQGFARRKRIHKIPIPVEEHPTYNFIGLIIGPRGKTQKELEVKTNCKIAIRGKGSVKEGARGRRDGRVYDGENEPLHVLISGESQENVDKAAALIQQMLVVIDDEQNQFKQNQLRELALLNGTLKDDDYCILCAEKGHRQFECPKRFTNIKNGGLLQVKCAICGDSSHPTRDCTQNKGGTDGDGDGTAGSNKDEKHLDQEYMSFMAELDGKKVIKVEDDAAAGGAVLPPVCVPVSSGAGAASSAGTGNTATDIMAMVQEAKQGNNNNNNNTTALPKVTSMPPPPLPPPPSMNRNMNMNRMSLPPPPLGLPPPPTTGGMNVPPPGAIARYPPPPSHHGMSSMPPPPHTAHGYHPSIPPPAARGHGHGHGMMGLPPPPHHNMPPPPVYYGQQLHQGSYDPPPPVAVPAAPVSTVPAAATVDDELAGWDPNSFYSSGGGAAAGGAGGFNWWENGGAAAE